MIGRLPPMRPLAQAIEDAFGDLRDYQIGAIHAIRAALLAAIKKGGRRRICLVAPTGAGKTKIAAFIVRESAKKLKHVAFVCDRINLIDQTSRVFDQEGIYHGVIQSNHWRTNRHERVQVCSVQTLARRKWPPADVVLVDECHTISKTVQQHMDRHPQTTYIGLTATPFTKGLDKMYDTLINVATTNELIGRGFLAPFQIFAAREPDMHGVPLVNGEFEVAETSRRARKVVGDVVTEYMKFGRDRKFICSAVDTAHVQELERQFLAAGIITRAYTYREGDVERAEVVEEFRQPDSSIRGLITVTAASKGFDVPDIGVVIMARPLSSSLAEYIQLFGRGLRPSLGKDRLIVLDHSGNSERFWAEWTQFFAEGATEFVKGRKKKPAKPAKAAEAKPVKCPTCRMLHSPQPACPGCGHLYPPREAVRHAPGSLVELMNNFSRQEVTDRLFPQIVHEAQRLGKNEDWALSKFKAMTGQWPQADFYLVKPVPPDEWVRGQIKHLDIKYAKDQAAKRRAAAQDGVVAA